MIKKEDILPSEKALKRVIILMWLALMCFFVIKLLGANWFDIVCTNERFISICNFVDENIVVKIILCCITSYLSLGLLYLAIIQQWFFERRQLIIVLIVIPICVSIKLLVNNNILSWILDIVVLAIVVPIILKYPKGITKKYFLIHVIGIVLNLAFQIISLLIRNISIKIVDENTLISLILMLDVYIMLGLYYLYSNKIKVKKGEY